MTSQLDAARPGRVAAATAVLALAMLTAGCGGNSVASAQPGGRHGGQSHGQHNPQHNAQHSAVPAAPATAHRSDRRGPRGPRATQTSTPMNARSDSRKPLHGLTIALDPGHQLGNSRFPRKISRLVPAGGFKKPCNTTGTATDAGFPESTFAFKVAQRVRHRLHRLGAHVVMTRYVNSIHRWGPCVDVRGRFGNRHHHHADLKISIHGDGAGASDHGFDVIAPTDRAPWTHDIYLSSRRLARRVRHGLVSAHFSVADYVGRNGIDHRSDLATLNLSNIPTVLVELGNMRNAHDAAVMSSPHGRARFATGLLRGVRMFVHR